MFSQASTPKGGRSRGQQEGRHRPFSPVRVVVGDTTRAEALAEVMCVSLALAMVALASALTRGAWQTFMFVKFQVDSLTGNFTNPPDTRVGRF